MHAPTNGCDDPDAFQLVVQHDYALQIAEFSGMFL